MTMADRIVVIGDSRITQAEAPHDLYDRPANTEAPILDAVVKVVEPTSSKTHPVAEALERGVVAVSRDRPLVRHGGCVRPQASPSHGHPFDFACGERIN